MSTYDTKNKIAILSNGSLLTPEKLRWIEQHAPSVDIIQISIEGDEHLNDFIRGKGAFENILNTLELIQSSPIFCNLSLTVSKLNIKEIEKLIPLLISFNIPLMIRRFVPIGLGEKQMEQALPSPQETQELYKKIDELNNKYSLQDDINKFRTPYHGSRDKNKIIRIDNCMNGIYEDSLQSCGLTSKDSIVIMPDGDVIPCRLLPESLGNIKDKPLKEIYSSSVYNKYTQLNNKDPYCKDCSHFSTCQGGAMCISAAVYQDAFKKDPQCWK